MSKVKIQGNASGTGILTVAAPATNTDRTITLPDNDATLLSTAGGTITGDLGVGTSPDARLTVGGASADRVAHFVNTQNANGSIAYISVRPTSGGGALFGQTGNSTSTSQYTWLGNAGDDVAGGGGMGIWIYRGTADLRHKALPAFFARAWVNVRGDCGINGSGNISSVTDVGGNFPTQYFRVAFTVAMPDKNYNIVTGGGGYLKQYMDREASSDTDTGYKTSGQFELDVYGTSSTSDFHITIFR